MEVPVSIHVESNILFSMICILLFYQQKRHKSFGFLGTFAFNGLLWSAVGIMLLDSFSWFIMGEIIPYTVNGLMNVQCAYYFVQAVLPVLFVLYCADIAGLNTGRTMKMLLCIPAVATALLLVANYRTGFAFSVENKEILRGPGYIAVILPAMLCIIGSFALCVVIYVRSRRQGGEKRKVAFHMLICVVICVLGAAASALVAYVSPWYAFVTGLVYLYMQLHSHQEQSLDTMATTDSLTGLKNYASYSHIKERLDEKITADGTCRFAVAVMDVNDLKKVNDVYGHEAGNALIISAGQLMCRVFTHSPVCRIGGDEFVAILENSDYENREALIERFAEEMREATFLVGNEEKHLVVSLGMKKYVPECHERFEDVFQEADQAMYEQKARIKREQADVSE